MDSKVRDMALTEVCFILGGTLLTSIIVFYVLGYLLIKVEIAGNFDILNSIGISFLVLSFVVAPIIGGIIGYFIFKHTRYSDPLHYNKN
jgi:hypothetical protein